MQTTSRKITLALMMILLLSLFFTVSASAAGEAATEPEGGASVGITSSFQPLLDAFTSGSPDGLLTANFGNTFSLAVVILLLIGLVEALFGYKLLRIELTLGGFAAGAAIGGMLFNSGILYAYLNEVWMGWALMAVLGFIFTLVAYKLFRVALFLGVAFTVFSFASPLVNQLLGTLVPIPAVITVVAVLVGLLVGFLSLKLLRTVVILLTSAVGAFFISFALSGFIPVAGASYVIILLFFVIGAAVQIGAIKKRR